MLYSRPEARGIKESGLPGARLDQSSTHGATGNALYFTHVFNNVTVFYFSVIYRETATIVINDQ